MGDPNKETLVLVHGFAGSGALFYKAFKGLAEHFYVITFDLIGMGTSSRPYWYSADAEVADEFFI